MTKTSSYLLNVSAGLFSAVLLVLFLLTYVKLVAVNDRADTLEKEIQQLAAENDILEARCAFMTNLEEIEEYAVGRLGMEHCPPERIIFVDMEEPD